MTDKELQDLISLKKYEQPEEGYFEDFLVEFQQRQRSEMLKTSARQLLVERVKAWFSELGSKRTIKWVVGGGLAYASVAIFSNFNSEHETSDVIVAANEQGELMTSRDISAGKEEFEVAIDEVATNSKTVSMEYSQPVDFSSPRPVFSSEERYF